MENSYDLRGLLDLEAVQVNYRTSKSAMTRTTIPTGRCPEDESQMHSDFFSKIVETG